MRRKAKQLAVWLGTTLLAATAPALAQDWAQGVGKNLLVAGYATVAVGDTDVNHYQAGDENGSYRDSQLAISIHSVWQKVRVAAQFELETSGVFDGTKSQIDFAFGEWRFSDRLRLRMGKARHPFGIYAEVLDVGTLRPFHSLPFGVYGPTGVVAEHYTGLGLSGLFANSSAWEFSYDIYGGEVVLDAAHPWEALEKIGFEEDERLEVTEMVGARLVVTTPVLGLSFGASAYSGTGAPLRTGGDANEGEDGEAGGEGISGTHVTFGLQGEYSSEDWLVRSEFVSHDFEDRHEIEAFYLEIGYHLSRQWQLTARFDDADVELSKPRAILEIGRKAPSLLQHEDVSIGLNYWFSADLVAKLAYHFVEGNFFARPIRGALGPAARRSELRPETELLQLGVSLSF